MLFDEIKICVGGKTYSLGEAFCKAAAERLCRAAYSDNGR